MSTVFPDSYFATQTLNQSGTSSFGIGGMSFHSLFKSNFLPFFFPSGNDNEIVLLLRSYHLSFSSFHLPLSYHPSFRVPKDRMGEQHATLPLFHSTLFSSYQRTFKCKPNSCTYNFVFEEMVNIEISV